MIGTLLILLRPWRHDPYTSSWERWIISTVILFIIASGVLNIYLVVFR